MISALHDYSLKTVLWVEECRFDNDYDYDYDNDNDNDKDKDKDKDGKVFNPRNP